MRYLEPTTVDEALGALAEHGEEAKVIAGGQSLLIMMRERLVDPEVLIGLNAIPELRSLETNGEAVIGAMARHVDVEKLGGRGAWLAAGERPPRRRCRRSRSATAGRCAAASRTRSRRPTRRARWWRPTRACGSASTRGEREVAAEDFFVGLLETAAEPDELVTAVVLPAQPDGRADRVHEVLDPAAGLRDRRRRRAHRGHATARSRTRGSASTARRTAACGRRTPRTCCAAPSRRTSCSGGPATRRAAQSEPLADVDGNEDYKRHVVGVYTRRALEKAMA